jgi:hypothetical protein
MRRAFVAGLLMAAVAIPVVAGPARGATPNSLGLDASYQVEAEFQWQDRRVSVATHADVSNNTRWSVETLAFNLATLRTGRATVDTVIVDGTEVARDVRDQTILVPLPSPLGPGDGTQVDIEYHGRLNSSASAEGDDWEFARIGEVLTAYRWIPWLSRPTRFNRPNEGDPWVTAEANAVRVDVTTDRDVTIASSGRRVAVDGLTQIFEATEVRDFNLTASPSYRVHSATAAGVDITLYELGLPADAILDVAARALREFERNVGPYPHRQLTIAETGPWAPFESPAHFWLPSNASARLLPWMVAHEVGHQWFYSAVGSDQSLEPFADEATTDYMARDLISSFVDSPCPTDRLDHSIYDIAGCYAWVIYVQGDAWLGELRRDAGSGRFWRAISDYNSANAGELGGNHELLQALVSRLGRDAVDYRRFPYTYPARVISMPFGPVVP